jgi:hypothetical protein
MNKKIIVAGVCSVFIVFFWSVFSGSAFASHPLITDDTGTQGKGKFQMEVNGEYGHDKDDGLTTRTTQLASTLTYGLIDPLDIVLGIPYQHNRTEDSGRVTKGDGISDLSLEMKWRFYEKDGLTFALKPGITIPTGDSDKGLGAGKATAHLYFITTMEIKPWAFHLNLGYIRNESVNDGRTNIWHSSLASIVAVAKNLTIVANVGIIRNSDKNSGENPAFILGGLIYSLSAHTDLDFGVKAGLNKSETDYTLLAGFTFRG